MNHGETLILLKINEGTLRLCADLTTVEYFHNRKWIIKKPNYHYRTGRKRYGFKPLNKSVTIYANRLVWMITHREPIPHDMFVDHIDEDNSNDHPSNLQLMHYTTSHRQGYEKLMDHNLTYLMSYFNYVATGRIPLSDTDFTDFF